MRRILGRAQYRLRGGARSGHALHLVSQSLGSSVGNNIGQTERRSTRLFRIPRGAHRPRWTCQSLRGRRSEEHTSELQSPDHLVCRLLLEKKNTSAITTSTAIMEATYAMPTIDTVITLSLRMRVHGGTCATPCPTSCRTAEPNCDRHAAS